MIDGVLDLNLIHLFTFYLAAVFTVSTARRLRQYHDVAQLALAAPNRWPRVLRAAPRALDHVPHLGDPSARRPSRSACWPSR